MINHTPGPWTLRPAPYGWDIFNSPLSLWISSTMAPLGKDSPFYPSVEQTKANAELMASAPEMADEIIALRRALVDALAVFDIGEKTQFYQAYSDVISRAQIPDANNIPAGRLALASRGLS